VPTTVVVTSPVTLEGITYYGNTITVYKTVTVTSWATKTVYYTVYRTVYKTVTTTTTETVTKTVKTTVYPSIYTASTPMLYFAPTSTQATWTVYQIIGSKTTATIYDGTCAPFGITGTLVGDETQVINLGYVNGFDVFPQTVTVISVTPTEIVNAAPKIYCTDVTGSVILIEPSTITTSVNGTVTLTTYSTVTQTVSEPVATTIVGPAGITEFTTTFTSSIYLKIVTTLVTTTYQGIMTFVTTVTSLLSTITNSLLLLPVSMVIAPIGFGQTLVLGDALGAVKVTYTLAAANATASSSSIPAPALFAVILWTLAKIKRRN
jgi:hypothetical protein